MSESGFASLNTALLARKGGAKPAMRPQGGLAVPVAKVPQSDPADLEDLGWNDMGDESNAQDTNSGKIVSVHPKAEPSSASAASPARAQQDEIAKRVAKGSTQPDSSQSARSRQSAFSQGRRAAFTLRLDEDRHLRLRLAATIKGVSAQTFVTEALDAQLSEIDDLEALAAKIKKS